MPERREGQVAPVTGGLLGRHTYPRAIMTMLGLAVAYAMLGRLSLLLAIPPRLCDGDLAPSRPRLGGGPGGGAPGVAGHLARVISGQFLAYP
jgi:hypothetical protein